MDSAPWSKQASKLERRSCEGSKYQLCEQVRRNPIIWRSDGRIALVNLWRIKPDEMLNNSQPQLRLQQIAFHSTDSLSYQSMTCAYRQLARSVWEKARCYCTDTTFYRQGLRIQYRWQHKNLSTTNYQCPPSEYIHSKKVTFLKHVNKMQNINS